MKPDVKEKVIHSFNQTNNSLEPMYFIKNKYFYL